MAFPLTFSPWGAVSQIGRDDLTSPDNPPVRTAPGHRPGNTDAACAHPLGRMAPGPAGAATWTHRRPCLAGGRPLPRERGEPGPAEPAQRSDAPAQSACFGGGTHTVAHAGSTDAGSHRRGGGSAYLRCRDPGGRGEATAPGRRDRRSPTAGRLFGG